MLEKYTGKTLSGSSDDGRNARIISVTIDDFVGGDIQLYGATKELNLGLGGANLVGTGTGNTPAPFIDTGTGISIMANARKRKRDYLW